MTNAQADNDKLATDRKTKGRLILVAIVAIFVLPFVFLPMFMSPEQMQKTNKGVLIQPHVTFADLHAADVKNLSAVNGKWTLLYFVPEACEQLCVNALYSIRQVPRTLARDSDRVQPLLVTTSTMKADLVALVEKEFSSMSQANASKDAINAAFAQAMPGTEITSAGYIYLMSPDGYVFMYYPSYENEQEAINHALDIREDLKKSIKGSRF